MKKMCAGLLRKFLWLLPVLGLPLQAQVQTILHDFNGAPDGFSPGNAVLGNGLLFGSTPGGGLYNSGLVFALGTNGGDVIPVHDFTGNSDGGQPNDVVLDGGTLYGTTVSGGANGNGIVFKVGTNGTGFTVLYNFTNFPDGQIPITGLLVANGMIYGTTSGGGSNSYGTIFKLNTNGGNYSVLRHLNNATDGSVPRGALVINNATLYGTASGGGGNNLGTVFKLNTNGTGFAVIHQFTNSPDGAYPYAGLLLNSNTLYGTTFLGGSNSGGSVFKLNTNGTGYGVLRHLSSISAPASNSAGTYTKAGLALDNGMLYSVAAYGGTANGGTLFRLGTNGGNFSVLKNFADAPDGANPQGSVAVNGKTIYGFTYGGGAAGGGIAFSLLLSPLIAAQPQSVSVTNGDPASFTVTAANDESFVSYQWYFNATTLLAGQTNSTLNFAGVNNGNAGNYTVVLTDNFGSVTSAPALLTIFSPPVITAQPQNQTVTNGSFVTFNVTASGSGPLNYQWYFNTNTILIGQTNNPLNFANASNGNAGTYTVVIANTLGSVTSTPALLTIVSKPAITAQPQDSTVTNGGIASFTVTAVGASPLKYQWYSNSISGQIFTALTRLVGKTNATLTFTANFTNTSRYAVIITNSLGTATSSFAILTIISAPIITTNPQPVTVPPGSPASFTVDAIGAGTLRFQWYFNTNNVQTNLLGVALAGKTNNSISFAAASNNVAGRYTVVITNTFGSATSSPALLAINAQPPPVITLQPLSASITNGDPVSFTSAANASGTLTYQWLFRTNIVLVGATNPTLAYAHANLPGVYSMKATANSVSATSSFALLTVAGKPIIVSAAFVSNSANYTLSFVNLAGSTNRLMATTNLASAIAWRAIATNTMPTNTLWFYADTNTAKTNAIRFYRFSTP